MYTHLHACTHTLTLSKMRYENSTINKRRKKNEKLNDSRCVSYYYLFEWLTVWKYIRNCWFIGMVFGSRVTFLLLPSSLKIEWRFFTHVSFHSKYHTGRVDVLSAHHTLYKTDFNIYFSRLFHPSLVFIIKYYMHAYAEVMELCENSFMWMVDYFVKYILYDSPWKKNRALFLCHGIAQIFSSFLFRPILFTFIFLIFFLYKLRTKKSEFSRKKMPTNLFFTDVFLPPSCSRSPVSNIFRYIQASFRDLIRVNKIKIPSLAFLFRTFFCFLPIKMYFACSVAI